MTVTIDEFDIKPVNGPSFNPGRLETSADLVKALDKSPADARTALQKATDDTWQRSGACSSPARR